MNYQKYVNNIQQAIQNLIQQYRSLYDKKEYIEIKRIQMELNKTEFTSYKQIKEIENRLCKYFAKVWQKELTDFSSFQVGKSFKFVMTCPTVPADQYEFGSKDFISAQLITDKHFGTFNGSRYGVVCNVDEENFLSASAHDSHTISLEDVEGFESYFYTATTSSGKNLYNKEYTSGLKLPNQIEVELIKENLRENGEFISQKKKQVYSDITLDSKTTHPLGVLLYDPYTEKDYEEAKKIADQLKVGLLILPISIYYDKIKMAISKQEKHIYDTFDVDTIEFIVQQTEDLEREYSNLMVEHIADFISVKEETGIGKMVIRPKQEMASLLIFDDPRYFEISYKENQFHYFIDHEEVSKEEFQEVLEEKKKEKLSPKTL